MHLDESGEYGIDDIEINDLKERKSKIRVRKREKESGKNKNNVGTLRLVGVAA